MATIKWTYYSKTTAKHYFLETRHFFKFWANFLIFSTKIIRPYTPIDILFIRGEVVRDSKIKS